MKSQIKARILFLLFAIIFGSAAFWLAGCSQNEGTQGEQLYTCGMHPQVIQNKPGNCPICGMKLTPVRKQNATASTNLNIGGTNGEESGIITIDSATTQNMGLRTGVVTRGPLRRAIRTVGVIDYDETALSE